MAVQKANLSEPHDSVFNSNQELTARIAGNCEALSKWIAQDFLVDMEFWISGGHPGGRAARRRDKLWPLWSVTTGNLSWRGRGCYPIQDRVV